MRPADPDHALLHLIGEFEVVIASMHTLALLSHDVPEGRELYAAQLTEARQLAHRIFKTSAHTPEALAAKADVRRRAAESIATDMHLIRRSGEHAAAARSQAALAIA